jgi:hypothetical protein
LEMNPHQLMISMVSIRMVSLLEVGLHFQTHSYIISSRSCTLLYIYIHISIQLYPVISPFWRVCCPHCWWQITHDFLIFAAKIPWNPRPDWGGLGRC